MNPADGLAAPASAVKSVVRDQMYIWHLDIRGPNVCCGRLAVAWGGFKFLASVDLISTRTKLLPRRDPLPGP